MSVQEGENRSRERVLCDLISRLGKGMRSYKKQITSDTSVTRGHTRESKRLKKWTSNGKGEEGRGRQGVLYLVELAGGEWVVLFVVDVHSERLRHRQFKHVFASTQLTLRQQLQEADWVVRVDAHLLLLT